MSLINPEWLDFDKHTKKLNASGWYATCEDTIDNKIMADCIQRGITIPTDIITGYIDSPVLRVIAVDYAVFMLLVGNWGIRDDDAQLYRDKAQYHWSQYDKAIKNLCPTLV